MKKFLKFLFCTATLAAAGFGVYCLVKNIKNDSNEDDFDDLDDDFDEFDTEDESTNADSREYVPINLNGSEDEEAGEESTKHYEADEPEATEE